MSQPPTLPSLGQLRWQCRRGMLELDYLLLGFLDRNYENLTQVQQGAFVRMLDFEDQLLLDWLMGNVIPSDPLFRELVELMRSPKE